MKHKKTKARYRLRNWGEYNRALVQRGSLTLWLSEDVLTAWQNTARTGKRGHPHTYTDTAILTLATVQEVYHLRLRQTQGLMESLKDLWGLEVRVPDYSTLCRRRATLEVEVPCTRGGEALHLVVDSTGVKVFGEGEWTVRQHGYTRRRTWRKVHLGLDEASGEIVAAVVTTHNYRDSQVLPDLLEQVDEAIEHVSGDGGYDRRNCYAALRARQARATIPPQRNAKIWQHGNTQAERLARDQNLRRIRQIGRAAWKRESGYHRRSLAETAMFRLKTIFGDRVTARRFAGQAAQVLVRCATLNRLTSLGMPDSYAA
ncbi:MAG: IS5 family transposase [Candidatus Binatia bacterium]